MGLKLMWGGYRNWYARPRLIFGRGGSRRSPMTEPPIVQIFTCAWLRKGSSRGLKTGISGNTRPRRCCRDRMATAIWPNRPVHHQSCSAADFHQSQLPMRRHRVRHEHRFRLRAIGVRGSVATRALYSSNDHSHQHQAECAAPVAQLDRAAVS